MTIGICIPFYLRGHAENNAYKLVFKHYASLGYTVHLCGSEGSHSRNFAEPFLSDKVKYFEVPQDGFCKHSAGDDNLRKKFNDSLETLKQSGDFNWYCLAGADDIVPESFFSRLELSNAGRVVMAGVSSESPLLIVPSKGKPFRCYIRYHHEILPGVNCFSASAMNMSKWRPYHLTGCETGAERYFKENGYVVKIPAHVVMIKGESVLNKSEKIALRHGVVTCSEDEMKIIESYL